MEVAHCVLLGFCGMEGEMMNVKCEMSDITLFLASPFPTERVLDLTRFYSILFFKVNSLSAIPQSPFGVVTSSLDTMCFNIRSSAFWGPRKYKVTHG